jgi:REP element-mobilizing transposase RayT
MRDRTTPRGRVQRSMAYRRRGRRPPSPAHNRCAPATDSFAARCNDRGLRHRRRLRLRYYDYASSGAYFVTVCSRERACIFARVLDDRVDLSPIGGIVEESWFAIPRHHREVQLDAFVVMPNHVHGIVALHPGRTGPAPTSACDRRSVQGTREPDRRSAPVAAGLLRASDPR